MMEQHVALANHCKQVRPIAQSRGDGRDERRVAQFRRVVALINRHQPRRVQRTVDDVQVLLPQAERTEQCLTDVGRAISFHFQPDGVAFATVVEFVLNRFEQVRDFLFVDVKLAVARDPEMPVAEDLRAREQVRQIVADEVTQENVVPARVLPRQTHEPWQDARHLHDGKMPEHLAALRHLQLDHHVQRLVEQLRKRVGRIDRQGCEHGTDLGAVIILDPFEVHRLQFVEMQETNAVVSERRQQFLSPAGVLLFDHAADTRGDGSKRFRGGQAVHAPFDDLAFHLLFEASHADFEKLVEVRAGDAKELDPLQQRGVRVQGFGKHALVKLQPA